MSLSIALTKGRLEKKTVALLEQCGYGIESLKDKGRALVFQDTKKDVRYFLVKSNDCITYVVHGVAVFCLEREFRMFGRNSEERRD